VIDHFRVIEARAARVGGLPAGIWFVVEPLVRSVDELPDVGSPVLIHTPGGETLPSRIRERVVRHGCAAFRLGDPELEDLPRLSILEVTAPR
jgi:hypothetical protein